MRNYETFTFDVPASSVPLKPRFALPRSATITGCRISTNLQALGANYSGSVAKFRLLFNNERTGMEGLVQRDWNCKRSDYLMRTSIPIESTPFEILYEPLVTTAHTVTIILEYET